MTSGAIRKHKDKKDKKTHEKKLKKKKKLNKSVPGEEDGINDEEDSSEGNVDLNEELNPIGYYINDREEMINQMFSVIKGSKLRAMLPPILKDSTIDELKSQCLDELLGMSSKRIHSILEGRELETSSDSDEASSAAENENTLPASPTDSKGQWSNDAVTGTQDKDLEEVDKDCVNNERTGMPNGPVADVDTLEIGITKKEMGELLNYLPHTKQCERKRASSACETEPAGVVAKRSKGKVNNWRLEKEPEKHIKGSTKKNTVKPEEVGSPSITESVNEEDSTAKTDESKGKTLLEILELEMRARAIRALLKQQTAGDSEDVETCDEESDTSPSEVNKSSSLNTVCNAVGSGKDNAVGSVGFDTSPEAIRQKFGHKGKDNVLLNECTVNADPTNDLSSTASLKVSVDISAIHQLPSSAQNAELCSPTEIDHTIGIKLSGLSRGVDQAANGDSSQGSLCSSIKSEVIHGDSRTQDTDSMKSDLPFEIITQQKPKSYVAEHKEIETINTSDEPYKEDGELSNDDDDDDEDDDDDNDKSSESVLEVQPEGSCNDVIILDDSDDEILELHTNSKFQNTSVQQTDDSQNLSNEKLPEYDNHIHDSSTSTEMSGPLNIASKECNIKYCKSSVSHQISGFTKQNLAQTHNEEFLETEINEHYMSENHCKRSDAVAECSWATRWLQSKDVQKVVSTSKMCAKIRNRMKSAHKVKKVIAVTNYPEESCKSPVVIVGSVNEYNMLDKPKCDDSETAENTSRSLEQNSS